MTYAELVAELAPVLDGPQAVRWLIDAVVSGDWRSSDEATHADEVRRRAAAVALGQPLQYACGSWGFRHLELAVDPRVLIPRPETEQVVERALGAVAGRTLQVAVDLGTGSGAIACSLATELQGIEVHASDASADALDLARGNAAANGACITFHHGSWWEAIPAELSGRVDLLVTNPPYVTAAEYEDLEITVKAEPYSALVAGASTGGVDGLADIEAIVEGAPRFLAPGAVVVIECGDTQTEALAALCRSLGDVETFTDLAGKPRGVVVRCRP